MDKALLTRWHKLILISLWILVLSVVIGLIILFNNLSKSGIPSFTEIENPKYNVASIIYGSKNDEIGKYFVDNRVNLSFDEVNPNVIKTLINTEDYRYFSHSGIDFRSLFRVAIKTVVLQQKSAGGGSTITQQLAKLLYKRPSLRGKNKMQYVFGLIALKLREWITAIKLESNYTKEEIIAMYLNKFDFIYGATGLYAASETYFNKNQTELDISEAAVLVGMLKNPSLYNPNRHIKNAESRRNLLLSLLLEKDQLDQVSYDSLTSKPIDISNFKKETHLVGNALHFRASLAKKVKSLLHKPDYLKSDGTPYNLYTDGLKIYTSIDMNYQKKAEEAVRDHMKWNQEKYWEVWKRKDPWTFEATPYQKELRKNDLISKCKASPRYLNLREQYLGETIHKINQKYNQLSFSDNIIKVLLEIENGKITWNDKTTKIIKNHSHYKSIMKKNAWTKLKSDWLALQEAYDLVFNKKKKLKIFDYNEEGEKEVEMSPLDSVKYHAQILQAGMLAVDPHTGYIKAWVGGVDYNHFKYDHIESRRQVGSTIKPFVYATATSLQGISPCQGFEDVQYSIVPGESNFDVDKEWSPANANKKFTGNLYNLYQGLLYSKNSITIRLVKEMGSVQVIRKLLENSGIDIHEKLYNGRELVPNLPSICLGSVDLSVKEMVGAYTIFANKGLYVKPSMVQRIEDNTGKEIYRHTPVSKQALSPLYTSILVDMLRNNVGGRYGLGVTTQIGGKTGTTNDYNDGWFMSITPDLVTGVWVGGDNKWFRFLTLDDGQGYVVARPIVQEFIQKLEKDKNSGFNSKGKFPSPPKGFQALSDCDKYKVLSPEDEIKKRMEKIELEDDMEEELEDLEEEGLEEDIDETDADETDADENEEEIDIEDEVTNMGKVIEKIDTIEKQDTYPKEIIDQPIDNKTPQEVIQKTDTLK